MKMNSFLKKLFVKVFFLSLFPFVANAYETCSEARVEVGALRYQYQESNHREYSDLVALEKEIRYIYDECGCETQECYKHKRHVYAQDELRKAVGKANRGTLFNGFNFLFSEEDSAQNLVETLYDKYTADEFI